MQKIENIRKSQGELIVNLKNLSKEISNKPPTQTQSQIVFFYL